jgi:hypothetical protein
MREPDNLHPPRAESNRLPRSRRRPRPRIWAERSVQVLPPVGIAPRHRGAGATRKAVRSPKEHGLIVSPPAWRGAALQYGSSIGY